MTTTLQAHLNPAVRHDIVFLFDVTDGNPNGDPDAGNQPRVDAETGHGLITDVALKRKIRDTVTLIHPDDQRYRIFVQAGYALNPRIEEAFIASELKLSKTPSHQDAATARVWLTERYVDLRLFGGVLSTGRANAGQIRGPLQFTFARSVDPVLPADHAITRVTQTRQEDIDKGESTEMGGKWTVPYGLYRAEAFYSGTLGQRTGVSAEDLDAVYRAMVNMFDHDRSAARGKMSPRGIYVFSHSDAFGNAPAGRLTDSIQVHRRDPGRPPRSFQDYEVIRPDEASVTGVTLTIVYE